ncbi:formate dehydrogenase accessory sulfurtransferase FdhD [Neptunomonas phycophila]|uniref:Sulfur carrier protein FdhD n=1 Tax=Neptunomonas phycophila TaxID=1572645 RepID=A0ABT9EYW7_9GAMM|nr:formate dehydrogenase accessory sulfurtransferase FdhD [Neptunomonas phycophila]MDO6469848.1 formate dehydrogenase accessory sulfurtransferase FdhD [Neptunomonas phycophila]MDP2524206.1 formate dehydrogenase accessory sulfurtransferase FdhD [Neptunomonas phycophila]
MEQPFESVIRSYAQAPLTEQATVIDELGGERTIQIACERPLTIYLNKREIVTLMTLGADPEALVVGYLKNQGFIERAEDLTAVQVDWDVESAAVVTRKEPAHLESMLEKRTVTSGCGQGTMFGDLMEKIANVELPVTPVKQSMIYSLLRALSQHNETYKNAGAVHACAVSDGDYIVSFVEDVGRHNAVDTLAGRLWLQGISPNGKIFYTTGRLTSEMVIKVAQMGISVLLSRSGVTQMGLALAREMGITLLARAKGRHFLIFHGRDTVDLDCLQEGKGVQGE